ncbi:MAG: hypothetical protein M0Q93_07995 [Terrimicrobiaceae bacterium]|nr:hypothetical protein [Terrimicrobiaceae bacterium]
MRELQKFAGTDGGGDGSGAPSRDGKIPAEKREERRAEERAREQQDRAVLRRHEYWAARQSKTSGELREQWQSDIQGWGNYFQLADRRWEVRL